MSARAGRLSPRTGCGWRVSGCAPGRCAPRCRRSGSRSARRRSWRSSGCRPPRRPGCSREIDRLGTNLLTVEAGQSLTGQPAKLPVEAPGRITLLDHVQLLAHTGLMKDEKVYRSSMIPAANSGGLQVRATSLNLLSVLNTGIARGPGSTRAPPASRSPSSGRSPPSAWASTASTPISGSGWEAGGSTSRASWSPRRWRPTSTPAPWSATRPPRGTSATSASSAASSRPARRARSTCAPPPATRPRCSRCSRRPPTPRHPTRSTSASPPTCSPPGPPRRGRSTASSSGSGSWP